MKKELQLELWHECNSGCKFCYLKGYNGIASNDLKIYALKQAIKTISDLSLYTEKGYNVLGYIGGEFFQGQQNTEEIRQLFLELMDKTNWLRNNGYIDSVWIYATMTIGDQKDLYTTLERFDTKKNFWLLTSYDTIGRFHTQKMEDNWKYHMKNISKLYPDIRFNITSILTGDLLDKYIRDEISFKKMQEEYKSTFFFKQCGTFQNKTIKEVNEELPNFIPRRDQFLNFLKKFYKEESKDMWDRLMNIDYRADALYRMYDTFGRNMVLYTRNKETGVEECKGTEEYHLNPKCGHMTTYQAYCDSDECMLCDKTLVQKLYEGGI